MLRSSNETDKIDVALAKAQGKVRHAEKNSVNPHFKSRFADLASIVDACRAALAEAGVAIVQAPSSEGKAVTVTTRLSHAGQFYESDLTTEAQQAGPQALGSCISYLKRYALASMVGVATGDDDDGEASEGREHQQSAPRKPQTSDDHADAAAALVRDRPAAVTKLWNDSGTLFGEKDRERYWRGAVARVFGANAPPPNTWTDDKTKAVEAELMKLSAEKKAAA